MHRGTAGTDGQWSKEDGSCARRLGSMTWQDLVAPQQITAVTYKHYSNFPYKLTKLGSPISARPLRSIETRNPLHSRSPVWDKLRISDSEHLIAQKHSGMSRDGSDAAGAAGPSRATVNKRGGKSDAAPREASRTPAAIFVAVLIGAAAIFAAYMIQNMEDTGNVRGPGKYAAAIPALRAVAAQLLHPEKGILAADESPTTFGARVRRAQGTQRYLVT